MASNVAWARTPVVREFLELDIDEHRELQAYYAQRDMAYGRSVWDVPSLDVVRLLHGYGDEIAAVGFSGHHKGISLDVAAYTLGATFIERHFKLDRAWNGTDYAASLEPDGLRRLERNLEEASEALRPRPAGVLCVEEPQRDKLKWRGDGLSTESGRTGPCQPCFTTAPDGRSR